MFKLEDVESSVEKYSISPASPIKSFLSSSFPTAAALFPDRRTKRFIEVGNVILSDTVACYVNTEEIKGEEQR